MDFRDKNRPSSFKCMTFDSALLKPEEKQEEQNFQAFFSGSPTLSLKDPCSPPLGIHSGLHPPVIRKLTPDVTEIELLLPEY